MRGCKGAGMHTPVCRSQRRDRMGFERSERGRREADVAAAKKKEEIFD